MMLLRCPQIKKSGEDILEDYDVCSIYRQIGVVFEEALFFLDASNVFVVFTTYERTVSCLSLRKTDANIIETISKITLCCHELSLALPHIKRHIDLLRNTRSAYCSHVDLVIWPQ
ncbi:hypothetical protein AVEN_149265-1 [Araneus ventricosus]|uniref:Uncharacterized protein n=1 Tax=Araneus ventricosus TaxID=182803 RepID=A0A4Y2ICE6_ARAVE|nr:hypothetical protein AVEN_21614-1 [Araneus ventricosus]GBM75348.1 hypothetical protein AVEN_56686-1 [Araneus ventricosus]GBM75366.1 hypothetical protein AVEN_77198-1 [Araneus ventricosus]GBM75387.1 hypothetical protein AVEN_149265-1 [Araneus ventricosus]